MQTARLTRSSVLGKRPHLPDSSLAASPGQKVDQLHTPDATPSAKRVRTSLNLCDGDSNKENVPPCSGDVPKVETCPPTSRKGCGLTRAPSEVTTSPARSRAAALRRTTTAARIQTDASLLSIATPPPTPPKLLLPIYARARALLRATCNSEDSQIAGREEETAKIHGFIDSFLGSSKEVKEAPLALYISGSPGTGKTALVNTVLHTITAADVRVVNINCMALSNVDTLWDRLFEEIQQTTSKRKGTGRSKKLGVREALELLLSTTETRCIVLLDELDHIAPNSQTLNALFSIPAKVPTKIRVIGIANTHTLTSSGALSADSPAANVETIHFAPYTPAQLQQILQSRLAPLSDVASGGYPECEVKKFMPAPTLMLLTKKVAGLTGDVRSLFEVLRGAIDLAVSASTSALDDDDNPLNKPAPSITPNHILASFKAYAPSSSSKSAVASTSLLPSRSSSNSEIITKVRNLGLQARIVLLIVLIASRRLEAGLLLSSSNSTTSTPKKQPPTPSKRNALLTSCRSMSSLGGLDTKELHSFYSTVLNRQDAEIFEPVQRSEFCDLVNILEGTGLLASTSATVSSTSVSLTPSKRRAFSRSSSFVGGKALSGGGVGNTTSEVKLATGVWAEEILRGLGICEGQDVPITKNDGAETAAVDVREEELAVIWEREKIRINRELKNLARVNAAPASDSGVGSLGCARKGFEEPIAEEDC